MYVLAPVNEVGRFEKCIRESGIKQDNVLFGKTTFMKVKY
jgi:hypothetical protein